MTRHRITNSTRAERARVARDLHDTLGQSLAGITLQIDTARRLLPHLPSEASKHLELARRIACGAQGDLRDLLWDLRPRVLDDLGLVGAIHQLTQRMAAGTGLQIKLEIEGAPRSLSNEIEKSLLRIAQEALANVVKHAGASAVAVRLAFERDVVTLTITDNGNRAPLRFDTDGLHFGIRNMAERAKHLGGCFSIGPIDGNGTRVRVTVPTVRTNQTCSRTNSPTRSSP